MAEAPVELTGHDYAAVCLDCLGIGSAAPLVAAPADVRAAAPAAATPPQTAAAASASWPGRLRGFFSRRGRSRSSRTQAQTGDAAVAGSAAEPLLPAPEAAEAGAMQERRAVSEAPQAVNRSAASSTAPARLRSSSLSSALSQRRHGVAPAPQGTEVGYSSRGFEKRRISGEFVTVGLVNTGPDAEVSELPQLTLQQSQCYWHLLPQR